MNLPSPGPLGELFVEQPEEDDDDDAQGEADQNLRILSGMAKNLLRSNCSPQDGGGEEGVDAWAGELELRIGSADASDALHLEVENAGADNSADECSNDLGDEGLTRWNLDIVGELEIVTEPHGVCAGDVAKGLEVVHGQRIAIDKRATNELSQHVEGDLNACHGLDDTHGNDKDDAECQAIKHNAGRRVCIPPGNASNAQGNSKHKADQVPPLRNLGVCLHQPVVNVENSLVLDRVLLLAEACEK